MDTHTPIYKHKQWPKGSEPGHSEVWQMSLWRLHQHPSLWATTPHPNLWPLWAHTVNTTSSAMSKHRGQEPSFNTLETVTKLCVKRRANERANIHAHDSIVNSLSNVATSAFHLYFNSLGKMLCIQWHVHTQTCFCWKSEHIT